MSKRVLDINDLNVGFSSYGETTKIVTDVSFHIDEGETVGIVGESGCGKSVTMSTILRLDGAVRHAPDQVPARLHKGRNPPQWKEPSGAIRAPDV